MNTKTRDPVPARMRALGATSRHRTDRHLYRLDETTLYVADIEAVAEKVRRGAAS